MTDGTQAITGIYTVAMIVLALLVIVGIVWGMRQKRRRAEGQREFEAHAEEAGVPIAAPDAPPPPPPPVAPAPPPIADAPAAGTPPVVEEPRPLADEPIAAAVARDGTTATIAVDAAAAPADAAPADGPVTQLKGLGPKVAARLAELGVDRVGQIAALDEAGVAALDAQMGPFTGRIARDRWVEQARLLAAGDREGFERVFGRL